MRTTALSARIHALARAGALAIVVAGSTAAGASGKYIDVIPFDDKWDASIDGVDQGVEQGPFGSVGNACAIEQTVNSNWPVNTTLDIRRTFWSHPGQTGVQVMVAVDNDVQVYVNGTDISGYVAHEGCAYKWDNIFDVPDELLNPGKNDILVHAVDRGGVSFLGVKVRERAPR